MKLKLIKPKIRKNTHIVNVYYYDIIKNEVKYAVPPLSLAIVASLTPEDIEVMIIDENIEEIDFNEPVDLVGITITSMAATRGYEIADIFRAKNIPVVLGGIHVNLMPKESLKHADAIVIGEAESVWRKVINDFKNNHLKKTYSNMKRPDLAGMPWPRWDLIKNNKYRIATIMPTRGCPHNCEFCVVEKQFGNKIRKRPVKEVIKEIIYLKKYYKLFWFVDYNLFYNRAYAKKLLRELIPLKINYICYANTYIHEDDELLKLMAESGCKAASIGFETLNPKNLKLINKTKINKIEEYSQIIKKIQDYGIKVKTQFIVGLDYDHAAVFKYIKDFVDKNNILFPDIFIAGVFYGTKYYQRLKKEKRINKNHYSTGSYYCTWDLKSMNYYDARFGYALLYQQLYNYNAIFKRIKNFYDEYKDQIEQPYQKLPLKKILENNRNKVIIILLFLKRIKSFKKIWFMLKLLWHPKSIYKYDMWNASNVLSGIEWRSSAQQAFFFDAYLDYKRNEEYSKNPIQNKFNSNIKINLQKDIEKFIKEKYQHYKRVMGNDIGTF